MGTLPTWNKSLPSFCFSLFGAFWYCVASFWFCSWEMITCITASRHVSYLSNCFRQEQNLSWPSLAFLDTLMMAMCFFVCLFFCWASFLRASGTVKSFSLPSLTGQCGFSFRSHAAGLSLSNWWFTLTLFQCEIFANFLNTNSQMPPYLTFTFISLGIRWCWSIYFPSKGIQFLTDLYSTWRSRLWL